MTRALFAGTGALQRVANLIIPQCYDDGITGMAANVFLPLLLPYLASEGMDGNDTMPTWRPFEVSQPSRKQLVVGRAEG